MWLVNLLAYCAVAAIFAIVAGVVFVLALAFTGSALLAGVAAVLVGGVAASVPFVVAGAADDVIDKLFPPGRK